MHQSIQVIRGGTSSTTRRMSSSTFKKKRGVKFTLRFSRILPRFSKLCEARSRLHRRRCLQVNTRWKAFDEVDKIYILLHRSDLEISARSDRNVVQVFVIFHLKSRVCVFLFVRSMLLKIIRMLRFVEKTAKSLSRYAES